MPRITAERLQDRRDSILAAARQVFARKGFAQASISDIAQIAGTSDGLIYRYFESKRVLLIEVLSAFYGRLIAGTEQIIDAQPDFAGKLTALVQRHVQAFAEDTDLCRLFIAEVRNFDDYIGSASQELNRRYTSILLRVIASGVEQGAVSPEIDPRLIRDMLFGGIEHLAWRHISGGIAIDVDGTARQISTLLLGGLKGTAA
ncbi:TetR/AcrR family transcriptional regulator [Flavisphingomonas formosensis]|uniref:TetR/AcrR family transcriptional regulator n=1 Tax=Flavisphingomonas formosensis TaxID=861534 RepID=UPI0012FBBECE|nr:TetR/AcrR family transcriptional regulator [Sphingomonas formosensis]